MKILVVTQYFWPEQFKINDLCEALIERGHEVTVYTGIPNYPEGEFYKGYSFKGPYKESLGKIKIIRTPLIARGKNKSIKLILNYFSFFLVSSMLAPFLVRGKFDKILVYEPSPITVAVPGIVLRFLKRAPMFFWVTDLWPESLEATGIVKNKLLLKLVSLFVSILYKFSDRILVTSKGFIPRVKALGGRDLQIFYFPQWAEALYKRIPSPQFHDPNIPANGFKIMFAGNIGTSQDFQTIVEAAKLLIDYKNIFFLILGDGLMKNWAQTEIEKNKIQENFIFLGRKPIDEMPEYYSTADVMLMSLTNTDLFSITVPAKLQPYMASGKPILASMNGEGADIVREANAGIAVDAGKPRELADAILKFSQMPKDQLIRMGENAKKYYEQEFERETLISRLEAEFLKVSR